MLLDLGGHDSARALDRRLRFYAFRPRLCIDEIGYLSYGARNADLLFPVVIRRYEHRSLIARHILRVRIRTNVTGR